LCDEVDGVEDILRVIRHDGLVDKESHHPGEVMGGDGIKKNKGTGFMQPI
jgi:hypothetical protein